MKKLTSIISLVAVLVFAAAIIIGTVKYFNMPSPPELNFSPEEDVILILLVYIAFFKDKK